MSAIAFANVSAVVEFERPVAFSGWPERAKQSLNTVAKKHDIPVRLILSPSLRHDVVVARKAAVYAIFDLGGVFTNQSYLGRLFDRDHSTINYTLRPWMKNSRRGKP